MSVHPPPEIVPATDPNPGFRPYVPESQNLPELTWSALVLGSLLGIIFGASSLYLVLKVGMTVSASIPVAVLSITVFRGLTRAFKLPSASILQNNIVQTAGSAGESIAFGVGVTMPALMILGYDMEEPIFRVMGFGVTRVLLVAVLGGLLGILMMIPLRRAFIVKQHRDPYLPGRDGLRQGPDRGRAGGFERPDGLRRVRPGVRLSGRDARPQALAGDPEEEAFTQFKGAVLSLESSPVLMGVGYIIGFRTSCVMVGGGLLASMVLIPAIALFGGSATTPIFPGTKLISDMTPVEIYKTYVPLHRRRGRGDRRDHQPDPGPAHDRLVDGERPPRHRHLGRVGGEGPDGARLTALVRRAGHARPGRRHRLHQPESPPT